MVHDVQGQIDRMDQRYNELLDRMEAQLPDDATDLFKRLRRADTDFRKQMKKLGEQIREATRDMLDAFKDAGDQIQPAGKGSAPDDSWTKAKLYEEATRLDVSGRSKMSKQQLLDAVRAAD
jgi:predicted phage gp36 major capsid-like protein